MARYHIEYSDLKIASVRPTRDGSGAVRVDGIKPSAVVELFPRLEGKDSLTDKVVEIAPSINLDALLSEEQIVTTVGQVAVYTVMVNHQLYGDETLFFITQGHPDADQEVFDFLKSSFPSQNSQ